jgi:general stress protein 26
MVDSKTQIDFMEFLRSKLVAVLSTVAPDGQPESATIYFNVGENYSIYFMTKNFSEKYKNLESNPKVALVVGTENEPVTAQIQGIAEKITDPKEIDLRLKELMQRFLRNDYVAPLFQMSPPDKNKVVVYKITPFWIRWLDLRSEKEKVDGDFAQILP